MKMAKPFAVEEAAADEGKTNEKKYDCQEDDVVQKVVQKVSGRASWFQGKKDGHLARMSERMRRNGAVQGFYVAQREQPLQKSLLALLHF